MKEKNVIVINGVPTPAEKTISRSPRMTNEQLQNEYNYIMASQITKKMLDKGLITEREYKKIMNLNKRTFHPYLEDLMPDE